jgi:hypothetical protein
LSSRYVVSAVSAERKTPLATYVTRRGSVHTDLIGGVMTQEQVKKVFDDIFAEVTILREAGQKEYAHKLDNAFRNFENIGSYLDIDRKKVLLTYTIKHIDGIVAYVNGHKSQRESVKGRINDAIVYLMLLRCMIEDEETNDGWTV